MPTLKSTNFKLVALTTGDPSGIGFEIASKALLQLTIPPKTVFILYRDHKHHLRQPNYFKQLDKKFLRLTFTSQESALVFFNFMSTGRTFPENLLVDLALNTSAAQWVIDASTACLDKKITSLVTGPLSKTLIKKDGFSFVGHTGAFRKLCPKAKLNMAFAGEKFNVLLTTDHIPLSRVPKALTLKAILNSIHAARKFKHLIKSKKKIALVGLNPHAGEQGLLGTFEKNFLKKLPKDVVGPLVPDAAFLKKNWAKYSVYICMYHDQGLIPFKLVHGQDSGVHITMGLPFVRTSVDHGTAFDIYNKNLANPASMLDAIHLNLKLIRGRHV
ncbi:MAG: 4-hydroxythreonine-4-phosphate dehydrogenase PdxA [Pseudobdellovibrio sp.]